MTTNQPTAAETYASRRSDIARLIDVLQMELDKHAESQKADPKNWGFAGDLEELRLSLIKSVEAFSGIERVQIEAFLAE